MAIVALEIQQCFRRCFNDGHQVPNLRPSAQEWVRALKGAVQTLTLCGKVNSHYYSQTYRKCYWCDRSSQLGVDIFPTVVLPTVYSPSTLVTRPSPPVITRGNFLKWLGWGGVGLVTAVVGAEIWANTNQSQSAGGASSLIINIIFLASYLFSSYCFYKIYQKLGERDPWFAWVPILNTWIMYRAGNQSPYWTIGLCIPFVNILATVIGIIALVNIVKRLGKNPWLIVLMIIPLVGLAVQYYIAFG